MLGIYSPPEIISQKLNRLNEICNQYPDAVPVDVAAEFNGSTAESVRTALKTGTCPFGYAWNRGNRSGFCIPTIRFYLWVVGGA